MKFLAPFLLLVSCLFSSPVDNQAEQLRALATVTDRNLAALPPTVQPKIKAPSGMIQTSLKEEYVLIDLTTKEYCTFPKRWVVEPLPKLNMANAIIERERWALGRKHLPRGAKQLTPGQMLNRPALSRFFVITSDPASNEISAARADGRGIIRMPATSKRTN